jgi:hypothetical protein
MATIDDLGWKCAQCTFYHQAGDTRCGMCNELRRDFVPGVLILIPKEDGGDCNAPATTSAPTPSPITVPPNPVQAYTQSNREWTSKLREHQAIHQDGSLFRAVRDQALRQSALYKFDADQSSRSAQQFHQSESAVTAPFDLRPASSAATATAPDSLQKYVEGQVEDHVNILSNKAECLLCLEQYPEAGMAASEAFQINPEHVKSRAKASYLHALATPDDYGISRLWCSRLY